MRFDEKNHAFMSHTKCTSVSGSELLAIFLVKSQWSILNSAILVSMQLLSKPILTFFYLKNQFVISPFSFTENGFHWREPSPQICQKASIEARGRWQSSDLRVWAEWPSAARGHLVSPRSSSSHVFTIPESTNLRIFSRNFLWFILYKVQVFYWGQKCRYNRLL